MRSRRFEKWYANQIEQPIEYVTKMWNGVTYTSWEYHVETAWAAWQEAINGVYE